MNYNDKYKTREPKETIKILEDFFNSKGCIIKYEMQKETSTTYSCQTELFFDKIRIATSNGKGTSKEFCLASGLAELYERFSNKIFYIANSLLSEKILQKSFKTNGFYYSPNEKILSREEAFDFESARYYINHMSDTPNHLFELLDKFVYDRYIGLPFKNFADDNEIFYLDPRVSMLINGSSGMSAGNNFAEAFIQGMSELYEHYIGGQIFEDIKDKYYCLNLDNINLPNRLKDIIAAIEEYNDLYVIDISKTYNVPVLMSIIVNKKTHAISYNLGSSPIFEIAIERVFTELYQGISNYNDMKYTGQKPMKSFPDPRLVDAYWPGCTMTREVFPEHIIINMIEADDYDHNIFLSGEATEEALLNHIKDINKNIDWQVYYYDCSTCDDMVALKVVVKNLPYLLINYSYGDRINNKHEIINLAINIIDFIKEYYDTGKINNVLLSDILSDCENYFNPDDKENINFINSITLNRNQFNLSAGFSSVANTIEVMQSLIDGDLEIYKSGHPFAEHLATKVTSLYSNYINYLILYRYINDMDYYETHELLKIFNFLNLSVTSEDIQAIHNRDYMYQIENIIMSDIKNLREEIYEDYVQMISSSVWAK